MRIELGFKDSESSKDLKVNAEFATGVHTWELIFPICISNVEFGVISNSSLKKYSRKFKTTTPRFVTVTLDADKQRILYRLNKDPFTDKIVKIDTEGPYSPFVSTSKAEVEVILNPYPRVLNHQKLLVSFGALHPSNPTVSDLQMFCKDIRFMSEHSSCNFTIGKAIQ